MLYFFAISRNYFIPVSLSLPFSSLQAGKEKRPNYICSYKTKFSRIEACRGGGLFVYKGKGIDCIDPSAEKLFHSSSLIDNKI